MNANFIRKNLHLLISIAVLIIAAFVYGIFPDKFLSLLLDIRVYSVDLYNILRVTMCLYIGVAGLLITGLLKKEHWNSVTLLNTVFMGTMAFGRLLSMFLDGEPSMTFVLGMFGELILAVFSYLQYTIYGNK